MKRLFHGTEAQFRVSRIPAEDLVGLASLGHELGLRAECSDLASRIVDTAETATKTYEPRFISTSSSDHDRIHVKHTAAGCPVSASA